MANRYWVGGNANWDATAGTKWATTSGGSGGAAVPTAADDVYLDNGTGTGNVTIPTATTVVCRSLDCTGYTGNLTHASTTAILTIGHSTAGQGNIALKLVAGMTYTLTGGDATVNFVSTSATQQTVATGGKTMPTTALTGAGSSYTLSDSFTQVVTSTTNFTHSNGTFNTNNQTCQFGIFTCNGSNARTLTLGSSAITLTRNGTAMSITNTGITISANTAVITALYTATIGATGVNMNGTSLVFAGSGMVTLSASGGTWKDVTRTGTATTTDGLIIAGSVTVTGIFTATGNSLINRLLVVSNGIGTARTITAAAVSLTNVDFKDITGAGAATWTGTSIGNCLGNSNITFTANSGASNGAGGVNRYWVGGTGSWSSTTKWSETSGGSSGASIPLPQDDVFIDANSMGGNSQTVTINMPRIGRNIDWTDTTGTSNLIVTSNGTVIEFYGNWTLGGTITTSNVTGSGTLTACGRSSHTITSNGSVYYGGWEILAPGGTYTLQDDFNTFTPQVRNFALSRGTFNANGFNLSHGLYTITTAMTSVLMGSGTWTINRVAAASSWNLTASAGVISCGTSTIKYANQATGTQTFAGNGATYHILDATVNGTTGGITIAGANTFNDIKFSDSTNARTLILPASTTTTITSSNPFTFINGTSGKLMSIISSTSGTPATIALPNGYAGSSDYLSVKDITATTNTWYAGTNSTNVSGNTNITFTAAPIPVTGTGEFLIFM